MIKRSKLRLPILVTLLTLTISFLGIASVNAESLVWTAVSNPSAIDDVAVDVAVAPSGVYVVGFQSGAGDARWRIERRSTVNGQLLAAATSNPSIDPDYPNAVAVDGTGLYIVGYDMVGGNARWRIEKRTLLGLRLIWVATSNPSASYDIAYDVAVAASGVYVVGYDRVLGNARWRIERRSPVNGALLAPPVTINPSAGSDIAEAVAVDGTGAYIAGYDSAVGSTRWRIEKRTLIGLARLWVATSNPSAGDDVPYDIAVGPTGAYIVGFDMALGNGRWRIERRSTVNGQLLAAATSNPSPGTDQAYAVAIGATGIYVVGYDRVAPDDRWRIEKRTLLGLAPVWRVAFNPSLGTDHALSVVYASGIYTVGYDYAPPSNGEWRMERRTP